MTKIAPIWRISYYGSLVCDNPKEAFPEDYEEPPYDEIDETPRIKPLEDEPWD